MLIGKILLAAVLLVGAALALARRLTSRKALARIDRAQSWRENAERICARYGKGAPDRALVIGWLEGSERGVCAVGDHPSGGLVDGSTPFEIGSVTKTLTAWLLADAITREELLLDTTLGDVLGRLRLSPSVARITLQELATHTSGLPRLPPGIQKSSDKNDPYAHYNHEDLFASLEEIEVTPTASASYSNYGVGLLGEVLAVHQGTTYRELIESRLFSPMGLRSASIRVDEVCAPVEPVQGFMLGKRASHWTMPSLAGAGGVRLSMDDLLTFLSAHLSPPEDRRGLRDRLWKEQHRDPLTTLGLCWHIDGTPEDPIYWHNGSTYGATCFVAVRPQTNRAVAVLQNQSEMIGMMLGNDSAPDAIGWALIRSDEP